MYTGHRVYIVNLHAYGGFVVKFLFVLYRTGTYCVVATCLESYEGGDNQIDIGGTLRQMRAERAGMVQSVVQYELCHQAIADALLRIPDQRTRKQPRRVRWSDKLTGTPEAVAVQRRAAAAALRSSQAPQPQQAALSADYHRRGSVDSPLLQKPVPLSQPPPYSVSDSTALPQSQAPQLPPKTRSVRPELPPKPNDVSSHTSDDVLPSTPQGETESSTPPSPIKLHATVAEPVSRNVEDKVSETSADGDDKEERSSQTSERHGSVASTEDETRVEAKSDSDNATEAEIPSNQKEEAVGDVDVDVGEDVDFTRSAAREDSKEEDVARTELKDRGSSDTAAPTEVVTDGRSHEENEQNEVVSNSEISARNDIQPQLGQQPYQSVPSGESSVMSDSPQQTVTEEEEDGERQVTIADELTKTHAVDSEHEIEVVTPSRTPQQQVTSHPPQNTTESEKRDESSPTTPSNDERPDTDNGDALVASLDNESSVTVKNGSNNALFGRAISRTAGDEDERLSGRPIRKVPVKAPVGASLPRNDGKVGKLSLSRFQAFAAPKTEPTVVRKKISPKPAVPQTAAQSQEDQTTMPNAAAMSEETGRRDLSKVGVNGDNPDHDERDKREQRPTVVRQQPTDVPPRRGIGKLNTSMWESQVGGSGTKRAPALPQKKAPMAIASTYLGARRSPHSSLQALRGVSALSPQGVQPKTSASIQSVHKPGERRGEKTTTATQQNKGAKAVSQPPVEKSTATSTSQLKNRANMPQTESSRRNAQRDAERREAARAIGDSMELHIPDSPQPAVRRVSSQKIHTSNRRAAEMESRQLGAPVSIELTEEEKQIMAEGGEENDDLISSLMSVAADHTPKPKRSMELTEEEKRVLETMGQNEGDSNLVNSLMNL